MARLSRNLDRSERLVAYVLGDNGDWADTELRLDVDSGLYVAALRFVALGHAVCKFAVVRDCNSVWLGADQAVRFVVEPVEASAPSSPLSERATALRGISDRAVWSTTAVDGLASVDHSRLHSSAWTAQSRSVDVSQAVGARHALGLNARMSGMASDQLNRDRKQSRAVVPGVRILSTADVRRRASRIADAHRAQSSASNRATRRYGSCLARIASRSSFPLARAFGHPSTIGLERIDEALEAVR